jgi:hypothetical protein
MKKSSLSLLIGCFLVLSTRAQSTCGVYLTAQDFVSGKLYSLYLSKKGSKLPDEALIEKKHLVLNKNGAEMRVDQKDVYALRCSDGSIIRIYRDGRYTLLDPGESILIYMVKVYPAAKGNVLRTRYYFSKEAGSDIEALTLDNVKKAYSRNTKFDDALETEFRNDNELCAFDKAHNCYKLSRLYAANKL